MRTHPAHYFAGLIFFAAFAGAQTEGPAELERLRSAFQERVKQTDGELLTLVANYRSFLEKQSAALQAKGDLEAVLMLKQEVTNPGESKWERYPELRRAQEVFLSNQERLTAGRSGKIVALADLYRKNLQELMTALTKAGRLDDALKIKEELGRQGGPVEFPRPNLALAASQNKAAIALFEEAVPLAKGVQDEKVRNRLWRDLAIAYGRAGDFKQAAVIARRISEPSVEGRAFSEIALQQARLGDVDAAIALAKSAPGTWDQERALAGIASLQRQAGRGSLVDRTVAQIRAPAGTALCAIDVAESLWQKGDSAGFQKQLDQAKSVAQSLGEQQEMKEVFGRLAEVEVRAGRVDAAKETAKLYRGHSFGHPLLAVIATQAELGDYRGANETFNSARFTMYPACLAVASIADAQANAGKFEEATRNANRLWYSDHKLIALASVATKKGDLTAARSAVEGLLTADHMDGNRMERYGRALAPTAVLQAKLEGDAAAAQWARSLSDPVVRCLALIALGESRIQVAPSVAGP